MNKKLLVVGVAAVIVFLNQVLAQFISPQVQVPTSVAEDVAELIIPEDSGSAPANTTDARLYTVLSVIDGDTIDVDMGGVSKRVRYIGIDTPEIGREGRLDECYAVAARAQNEALLAGKQVRLVQDVSDTDQYGRLLRYVYADGVFINERLIAEGYARLVTYPPDVAMTESFRVLESSARLARLGLWGGCTE